MGEQRVYWLAWAQVRGVGPVLLRRIEQHFGTLEAAWKAPERALMAVDGIGDKLLRTIVEKRSQLNPEQFYQQHLQTNPQFWTPADPDYPRLLLEIPSPPPVLYYQGQVSADELQGEIPLVGIVGTRYPTEYGKRWTRRISKALAQQGFVVVSGMAAGIDKEAHQGCLETGQRTIAVMGTGLDRVYPPQNKELHSQILAQGLVLSEYHLGKQPEKSNFPARNRIIAGLCRAVIVIEAPQKSGALITARQANEFGRDVYVLPGSLESPQSLGCLGLLNQGAQVILGEDHLLDMLGAIPPLSDSKMGEQLPLFAPPKQQPKPQLSPELSQVYDAIAVEGSPFDLIVESSGLETGVVSGSLLQLELMGLITQLPGMRYQRL